MRHPTGAASCCASPSCPDPAWTPVPRIFQELDATASRQARPRAWLRAVVWLVEAGLHRRAGATTLAVARDLAGRMDYRLGFVLYDLEGTAARCGVSVATVKRHVRVLRELGALVWRRHGTKRNLHLPGRRYAGTATVYAAVIPAVYDAAMGHRLEGAGYGARVVGVTDAGRERAVEAVRASALPVDNPPARKRSSGSCAPHSSGRHHDVPRADVEEKGNYTPGRSPLQVARDIAVARQVRPLVGWIQREGLRRLAYALRPLIDRGLDARAIAAELCGLAAGWRPVRPAAWITAALGRDREEPVAHGRTDPPEAFQRAVIGTREPECVVGADSPWYGIEGLTREEVVDLRSAAASDPGLVLAALENLGERDTRRLYTNRLVDEALLYEFTGVRRGRTGSGHHPALM
ncbi:cell wall protein [Streptomyces sp. NBC_01336]|uniref:cell wall protein n=1 Tax=Streptomyces sp. NBC_01336 TaxID=2903829 RepID=UPI002E12B62C|nr:cell wall protein [Streptomyces sp. NBC_01336]